MDEVRFDLDLVSALLKGFYWYLSLLFVEVVVMFPRTEEMMIW